MMMMMMMMMSAAESGEQLGRTTISRDGDEWPDVRDSLCRDSLLQQRAA